MRGVKSEIFPWIINFLNSAMQTIEWRLNKKDKKKKWDGKRGDDKNTAFAQNDELRTLPLLTFFYLLSHFIYFWASNWLGHCFVIHLILIFLSPLLWLCLNFCWQKMGHEPALFEVISLCPSSLLPFCSILGFRLVANKIYNHELDVL